MKFHFPETDADRLRKELATLKLSQRAAARALDIDPRTVRRYCSGRYPVPRTVWLAIEALRGNMKSEKTS